VELLPEGCYLATSEAIPGLVAQGRTVAETLEIARDVAKRLLEARAERGELTAIAPPSINSISRGSAAWSWSCRIAGIHR
jgi:predicted RNase H-like HicB family nuclease